MPCVHLIGLMSGTSADAIDACCVRWEQGARPHLIAFARQPLPAEVQDAILRLQSPGVDEIELLGRLHTRLGALYAQAADAVRRKAGLAWTHIATISMHGQTLRHRVRIREPFTLQIGNAAVLAERTGCTVAFDFRSRDIAAGGEGAPLVPWAHRIFFADRDDLAVLNLGGIANITFLGKDGTILGFDCGPANAPLDALMLALTDGRLRFDAEGAWAARGKVDEALLSQLLAHPFLHAPPPKSADKHDFLGDWLEKLLAAPELSDADRLATASEWIVQSVAHAQRFLPRPPRRWLVCGGGVRNLHLMARLAAVLAPAKVQATDEAGLPAEAVEAACFALLGWHTVLGQPNIAPEVTGARRTVIAGALVPGENWDQLLRWRRQWT